jgi:hypothetical protein
LPELQVELMLEVRALPHWKLRESEGVPMEERKALTEFMYR